MNRRKFLLSTGAVLASGPLNPFLHSQEAPKAAAPTGKADHLLRIEPCSLDIGPGVTVKTLAFNSQVPGPLLRLRQGVPVTIDVTNAGPEADITHWHGLAIDSFNDGAMEEGSPMIPVRHYASLQLHPDPFRNSLVPHAHHRL